MHAVVFHGPGQKNWEEVPDPKILNDSDAIVRITSTTICGTDLHILKGDVPAMTPGRILGHEAVGTATETGPGCARSSRATTCCSPASRPAAAAATAGSASMASASAAAGGSSAT
jgi:threonine dehydrogenase-like Zn-dependent dehydrogenase